MPSLSCLVISRTPALLNRLLASLSAARSHWSDTDEVLCSWNGSAAAAAEIDPPETPSLRIAQRHPYHFAANMNALARQARGELVLVVNDDVVLDPGCLDRAIAQLTHAPEVGVVGGLLRTSAGRLGHAGLLFDASHRPYNRCRPQLAPLIPLDAAEVQRSGPIPAVTGALMLLRRSELLAVPFRESFHCCGEDVALCLDLRHKLGRWTYYASDVTAVHDEKSTRGRTDDSPDLEAVAAIVQPQLAGDPALQALQHLWQASEADWLTDLGLTTYQQQLNLQHDFEQRLRHWQQERALLVAQQEDLRQQLLATWASTSWRITRPLRLLGRLLRRSS
ncbi:MAG: glycosyltransferase [Cyanobacteria bacterium K_Offshore_0m_m2_072]|nr:glycosyltransferase [Cyanobacteria bacterium K_Offshore_0m_m2_072]